MGLISFPIVNWEVLDQQSFEGLNQQSFEGGGSLVHTQYFPEYTQYFPSSLPSLCFHSRSFKDVTDKTSGQCQVQEQEDAGVGRAQRPPRSLLLLLLCLRPPRSSLPPPPFPCVHLVHSFCSTPRPPRSSLLLYSVSLNTNKSE